MGSQFAVEPVQLVATQSSKGDRDAMILPPATGAHGHRTLAQVRHMAADDADHETIEIVLRQSHHLEGKLAGKLRSDSSSDICGPGAHGPGVQRAAPVRTACL